MGRFTITLVAGILQAFPAPSIALNRQILVTGVVEGAVAIKLVINFSLLQVAEKSDKVTPFGIREIPICIDDEVVLYQR